MKETDSYLLLKQSILFINVTFFEPSVACRGYNFNHFLHQHYMESGVNQLAEAHIFSTPGSELKC